MLLSTVLNEALRAEYHAFNIDREMLSQLAYLDFTQWLDGLKHAGIVDPESSPRTSRYRRIKGLGEAASVISPTLCS